MPSGTFPPNDLALPAPDRVQTREEFSEALQLLRGARSYRELTNLIFNLLGGGVDPG
ncbi:hypothetical protein AB0K27_20530 [Micromonospora echinospora]|uniref:hypothetical protein n=1 Tax=Micromonospora echinospora TaxID=1877 RepID=UPI00343B34AF